MITECLKGTVEIL